MDAETRLMVDVLVKELRATADGSFALDVEVCGLFVAASVAVASRSARIGVEAAIYALDAFRKTEGAVH